MSKILQRLYDGDIAPAEEYKPYLEEYKAIRTRNIEKYQEFVKKSGSPLDREFIQIMDEQLELCPLDLTTAYIDGFKLGVKMMIEVFEEENQDSYRGSICD